jgi:hypothetical protein
LFYAGTSHCRLASLFPQRRACFSDQESWSDVGLLMLRLADIYHPSGKGLTYIHDREVVRGLRSGWMLRA